MPDPTSAYLDALHEALRLRDRWTEVQNDKRFGHKEGCEYRTLSGLGYWKCEEGCNAPVKKATALMALAQDIAMADTREERLFRERVGRWMANHFPMGGEG